MRVPQPSGLTIVLLFIANCLSCSWSQPLPGLTPAEKPSNLSINATPTPANSTELAPLPPNARTLTVSEGVLLGGATQKIQPVYPLEAQAKGIMGEVKIRIAIDQEGYLREAVPLNGHPLLQAAASAAVKQWRWRPTIYDGPPIYITGTLTFHFPRRA